MANAIRDAFCFIYKEDVLENFANEMKEMLSEKNLKKFPQSPVRGKLDLSLVKRSIFFCI
jgi:DNA-directed RNA polymerase